MTARRLCGYLTGLIMGAGLYADSYWTAAFFGFLFFAFCVDEIGNNS